MSISQQLIQTRKQKGLTQEELAYRANVTVRTIQRIESGDSVPRAFTVKALAEALGVTFESLSGGARPEAVDTEAERFNLRMLCLSCFSFLLVPVVHFMLPVALLRKYRFSGPKFTRFARQVIWQQVYWVAATNGVMLLTVLYNFIAVRNFGPQWKLHYLWPLFAMYAVNAVLVMWNVRRVDSL